jgi:serine/threonine protein kinase
MSVSGTAVFGKYRLLVELGSGGMADVFLAVAEGPEGLGFSKLFVVKRLRQHLVDDPEFVTMLVDEARIAGRLNHPNVVQTIEIGHVNNQYFIAMEYLDGQPLHRLLARAKRLQSGFDSALHYGIISELLAGLHYAHELCDYDGAALQIVHRDVSPHNVFVTYAGQVKVVDFGIAKATGRVAETRTGVVKGKITYMAPEQALTKPHDRRADIFAVGVMLWQAVTGERFWDNQDEFSIMRHLAGGTYDPSPRRARPDVPDELDRICRRALAPNPDDRYGTAVEFQTDLENYLDSQSLRRAPRELGKAVSELFADSRAEVKQVVEEQLAALKASAEVRIQPISMRPPDAPSMAIPVIPRSVASRRDGAAEANTLIEETPSKSMAHTTGMAPVSTPRPIAALVAAAMAFMVAAGAIGVYALKKTPPANAATSTDTPPSADPSVGGVGKMILVLRGSPAEMRVRVDDGPPETVPYVRRFPKDGKTHRVVAEAPGYESTAKDVDFDSDQSMDLNLAKIPTTPEVAAPVRPTRPVPTTVRKPTPTTTTSPAITKPEGPKGEDLDMRK